MLSTVISYYQPKSAQFWNRTTPSMPFISFHCELVRVFPCMLQLHKLPGWPAASGTLGHFQSRSTWLVVGKCRHGPVTHCLCFPGWVQLQLLNGRPPLRAIPIPASAARTSSTQPTLGCILPPHTHTAHTPLLGHRLPQSQAPTDPRLMRPMCESSAVVSSKAAFSKPRVLPHFCPYPLLSVHFFQMGTPSLKKSMELFLRKQLFVLMTPPKRNRGRNKTGKWGRTQSRVFLIDPGEEMQFVVPSVNTSLSEETGVSSQNMRKHISAALAKWFVSYVFLRKPGVYTTGEAILSSQSVCSAWPNFCLRCY